MGGSSIRNQPGPVTLAEELETSMKKIALVAAALLTFGISSGSVEAQSRPGG